MPVSQDNVLQYARRRAVQALGSAGDDDPYIDRAQLIRKFGTEGPQAAAQLVEQKLLGYDPDDGLWWYLGRVR